MCLSVIEQFLDIAYVIDADFRRFKAPMIILRIKILSLYKTSVKQVNDHRH